MIGVRLSAPRGRHGFVFAVVVLLLFAISVASAAGYLVVNTEFGMARAAGQGVQASTVARAGLHRFVAEQLGVVRDSVGYAIGDGVALLTSRKIVELDSLAHLYYVRSEATVTDPLTAGSPARAVVGSYAIHRLRPLGRLAAMAVAADGGFAQSAGADVDGQDQNSAGDCVGGGAPPIPGISARYSTGALDGASLAGAPPGQAWSGPFAEFYASVGLRWDVLTDPDFPIEFDGVLPSYASIPADSFPVVRVSGYFNPGSSWSGRGLLIVDGELDTASGFVWEGIVLAGAMEDTQDGHVLGMLVGGLDGPDSGDVYWRGTVRYHSCNVYGANETLSYLELVENTEVESF